MCTFAYTLTFLSVCTHIFFSDIFRLFEIILGRMKVLLSWCFRIWFARVGFQQERQCCRVRHLKFLGMCSIHPWEQEPFLPWSTIPASASRVILWLNKLPLTSTHDFMSISQWLCKTFPKQVPQQQIFWIYLLMLKDWPATLSWKCQYFLSFSHLKLPSFFSSLSPKREDLLL